MSELVYVSLREKPELKQKAAEWFHAKWGVPTDSYLICMDAYLKKDTEYGWYLCLDQGNIVGGLGVIDNDFHNRQDLTPNVVALYVEETYRKKGIGGKLLDKVVKDTKAHGISPIYLVTTDTNYYEKYGWEHFGEVTNLADASTSRIYIHR